MVTKGNCYICGQELGKTAMKNHILKLHSAAVPGQECVLLKIEGAYDKDYWLFVDIPLTSTLTTLDRFLRDIWLECCGHLSAFSGKGHQEIGKSRKFSTFEPGDQFLHEYDFGSTTETLITVIGRTTRIPQKTAVRLLARNVPFQFTCVKCGAPAMDICTECIYEMDNPFYCAACAEKHEHEEMLLPITNSPRVGVCGYCGDADVYTFDVKKIAYKGKRA